jgi:branched-chain amino acid transport system ATP-binding protein
MLVVQDLHSYYGTSHILQGISLDLKRGEIVSLLGRNGAGKTTTLKSIMGIIHEKKGSVKYKGIELSRRKAFEIARLGIGYVPEDRRIYSEFTLGENLEIARRKSKDAVITWDAEKIYGLFPHLKKLGERRLGREMSGGEQQMLTIGRTLMGNPELLLLDEPSEGLAPIVVSMLAKSVLEIRNSGISILLSEQNTRFALKTAERAYVIDDGKIFFGGTIGELQKSEEVMKRHIIL